MSEFAFELENVCADVGGVRVLNNISINIKKGARISIIGSNGAGKTTLLRVLAGLIKPISGNFSICGRPAASFSNFDSARIIAYVPQMLEKSLPCKVKDFVLVARYAHGRHAFGAADAADRKAASRAIELTGITEFAERDISTLSGGERQKTLLAAAIAQETPVLLLDEPAAFLDYAHRLELKALLDAIRKERSVEGIPTTVIDVVHDLNGGALESDFIVALLNGRVAFWGTPAELISKAQLEEIYGVCFEFLRSSSTDRTVLVPIKLKVKHDEAFL